VAGEGGTAGAGARPADAGKVVPAAADAGKGKGSGADGAGGIGASDKAGGKAKEAGTRETADEADGTAKPGRSGTTDKAGKTEEAMEQEPSAHTIVIPPLSFSPGRPRSPLDPGGAISC
jgi:hypothetical protein